MNAVQKVILSNVKFPYINGRVTVGWNGIASMNIEGVKIKFYYRGDKWFHEFISVPTDLQKSLQEAWNSLTSSLN